MIFKLLNKSGTGFLTLDEFYGESLFVTLLRFMMSSFFFCHTAPFYDVFLPFCHTAPFYDVLNLCQSFVGDDRLGVFLPDVCECACECECLCFSVCASVC